MGETRGGRDTKRKLARVGMRLLATHGYHVTKVSDIVSECGLTQATFYLYFKTKLQFALSLIAEGREAMLRAVNRGYREAPAGEDAMIGNSQQWLQELLVFASANRPFMAILLARGHGADPEIDRAIAATREAVYAGLRKNIARATELGMLPKVGNVNLRAAFVHRLIEGTVEWWLFGHGYDLDHKPPVTARTLAAELVRFEFFGLRAGGSAGRVSRKTASQAMARPTKSST